ncbi:MAG: alcohol dehydrogenase catalytic domain-containing protein [Lentisphaeria bacterium]|nr:alcohol dehydrogenase catalytic domain-containing protein [Lentisphaeria bacterium]
MRASRLTGIRQMAMADVPVPTMRRDDDVLLRVVAVGVCGSDVHYYTTGRIGSQVVQYPFTVGHEMAGVVEAVGPGVRHLRPGDRVAVDPAVPCHACDQCLADRPHTCRNLVFLGCPGQIEGCLGEMLVMPEECCFRVPAEMDAGTAALVEPLSIGVYAVRRSIPLAGARIGILGMGPIGFSVLLPALAGGARAVYASEPIAARRRLALRHGATWAGDPETQDVVAEVTAREPELLDAVFECCGRQEALDQAMELLRPGGKLMLIGIPEFDRYSFSAETGRRREICLQHVRRQNGCVQAAIDMVVSGAVDPSFMITHRFPLEKAREAFDLVDAYGDGVLKAMVDVG